MVKRARVEDVAHLLRAVRKKLGLGQEDFARALGIKLSRYQKWERGASEPRFTITEMRRFRDLNPKVFDALLSGGCAKVRREKEDPGSARAPWSVDPGG